MIAADALRRSKSWTASRRLAPGLVLATLIASVAMALHRLPGFAAVSPLILAMVCGLAVGTMVTIPAAAKPGIAFAQQRILRFSIILLGLQLTVADLLSVGGRGLLVLALTLGATFVFTVRLGRVLGVERRLAELIAAGTAICGASAVLATNMVTRGKDEDVAAAVACVTVFGTVAMLLYPLAAVVLGLDARAYGLWAGASIHEVAQVVAAAVQHSAAAGEFATIAKLSRVLMLAPLVIALGCVAARSGENGTSGKPPLPWFILGFLALVIVNSFGLVPAAIKVPATSVTTFLLAVALAALGLGTDLGKLRAQGWRPFALALAAAIFIAVFSLSLVKLIA